jgi:hypothetical protein
MKKKAMPRARTAFGQSELLVSISKNLTRRGRGSQCFAHLENRGEENLTLFQEPNMSVVLDLNLKSFTCLSKGDSGNRENTNPQTRTEILQLLRLTQNLHKDLDESKGEVARHAKEGYAFVRLPMSHYLHVLEIYRYAEVVRKNGARVFLHTINDIMVVRIRKQEYTMFLSARENLTSGTWTTECLGVEKCNRAVAKAEEAQLDAFATAYAAYPNPINVAPVTKTTKSVNRYPNASGRVAKQDYQTNTSVGPANDYQTEQGGRT